MSRFLTVRLVNQGGVDLVASCAWARCAMLGQSVTASRYVDWMLHCWSAVVGRSISRFLTVHWVNRGVSIWLLARTASCTWARCCNARAVRNSESLRGLHATLREHRGRNRCWQLGRVESSELMTKTEQCLSTTDQVNGRVNRG